MVDVVRAAALRGFATVVRDRGGDPAKLLRRFRIPPATLESDDALIPNRPMVRMLEYAAEQLETPDLGMLVAEHQDVSILGPLALVMQHSATVGEALDAVARFVFVHSPAITLGTVDDPRGDRRHVGIRYTNEAAPPASQVHELALVVAHRVLLLNLGERYGLVEVHLPHPPVSPLPRYVQAFGAPVRFDQGSAVLRVRRSLLNRPLDTANELFRTMALDYLTTKYKDPTRAYSARVRGYLDQALGSGATDLTSVAATFGMHERTLQRHLVAEGTTYAELLDQARRDVAFQHLVNTDLPLSQVALASGLAEQSSLTRCSLRWFGKTPSVVRAEGG